MRYYRIKIEPEGGKWVVSCELDPEDRVEVDRGPRSLGFYNCPETKGAEQGFEELKELMITMREEEIRLLQKSLTELWKVTMPKITQEEA